MKLLDIIGTIVTILVAISLSTGLVLFFQWVYSLIV